MSGNLHLYRKDLEQIEKLIEIQAYRFKTWKYPNREVLEFIGITKTQIQGIPYKCTIRGAIDGYMVRLIIENEYLNKNIRNTAILRL